MQIGSELLDVDLTWAFDAGILQYCEAAAVLPESSGLFDCALISPSSLPFPRFGVHILSQVLKRSFDMYGAAVALFFRLLRFSYERLAADLSMQPIRPFKCYYHFRLSFWLVMPCIKGWKMSDHIPSTSCYHSIVSN